MPLAQLAQLAQPGLHCTALLTSHLHHCTALTLQHKPKSLYCAHGIHNCTLPCSHQPQLQMVMMMRDVVVVVGTHDQCQGPMVVGCYGGERAMAQN